MNILLTACVLLLGASFSQNVHAESPDASRPEGPFRFLVSQAHSKEECLAAVDLACEYGERFLAMCHWGCAAGDHSCYLLIPGEDEAAVRDALPRRWNGARIIKLIRFTPEQVALMHRR